MALVLTAMGAWWWRLQDNLGSAAALTAAAFVEAVAGNRIDEAFALCDPRTMSKHQLVTVHTNHRTVLTAADRSVTYAEVTPPSARVLVQYVVGTVRHRLEIDLVLRDRWMVEQVILLQN